MMMIVMVSMIVMLMVPIYVTLASKVIEHGDEVHSEQHPDPPCVEHFTSSSGVDDDYYYYHYYYYYGSSSSDNVSYDDDCFTNC